MLYNTLLTSTVTQCSRCTKPLPRYSTIYNISSSKTSCYRTTLQPSRTFHQTSNSTFLYPSRTNHQPSKPCSQASRTSNQPSRTFQKHSKPLQHSSRTFQEHFRTSQASRKLQEHFRTSQASRTLHTSPTLQDKRRAPFTPIIAEDNVVGLVNPEMMNRMRIRYPIQWLMAATWTGLGVMMLQSPDDMLPVVGGVFIASSVLFVGTMWYNARTIGKIALNQDTTATISHLNMMGKRVDKVVPVESLKLMTRHDHKQWIDNKLYYINWDYFKTNDKLWEYLIPAQKQQVLIPDKSKKSK